MPDPYLYSRETIGRLHRWIRENTRGSGAVTEFGAGRFDKLGYVWPPAKKIGIEVFPEYANRVPIDIKAVVGDFREWPRYLSEHETDCAMFIDSLEHVPKLDGLLLLRGMQDRFRKILVFAPDGFHEQEADSLNDGNKWNRHECGWSAEELESEGFVVEKDSEFHGPKGGALFAVWERK